MDSVAKTPTRVTVPGLVPDAAPDAEPDVPLRDRMDRLQSELVLARHLRETLSEGQPKALMASTLGEAFGNLAEAAVVAKAKENVSVHARARSRTRSAQLSAATVWRPAHSRGICVVARRVRGLGTCGGRLSHPSRRSDGPTLTPHPSTPSKSFLKMRKVTVKNHHLFLTPLCHRRR